MRNRKNLIQKSYYLDKEFDIDIIKFLNSCRNQSDLIRSALLLQMRVDNGEIDIDDIKSNKPKEVKELIKEVKINKQTKDTNKDVDKANKDDIKSFLQSCNIK